MRTDEMANLPGGAALRAADDTVELTSGNVWGTWRTATRHLARPHGACNVQMRAQPDHARWTRKLQIDALILWVNSNDPAWEEKYARYRAAEDCRGCFRRATDATRFQDVGELNRCLMSIARNAPWFRRIFILADDQTPDLHRLPAGIIEKIRIVSHRELFGSRSHVLPTFNSIVLDCMVWNLDEMSERFVYFNDDFFISRPVSQDDFFDGDRIIVRGHWRPIRRSMLSRLRRTLTGAAGRSTGFGEGQRRAAEMLGFKDRYFKFDHAPRAFLKSRMKSVFDAHREDVERNMSFRFRHPDQFVFFALYYHTEIANRRVTFGNAASTVSVKGSLAFTEELARLRAALGDPGVKFLCLQSLDLFTESQVADVLQHLDRHLDAEAPGAVARPLAAAGA